MPGNAPVWKHELARLMRFYPMRRAMRLGLSLLVPRHRVGVNLVPLDREGRVLLLKHVFHPFVPWGLPGGWLGRGEKPQDCALRELVEETGLTGQLGPLLVAGRKPDPPHLVMIYLGFVEPGPLQLSGEIIMANWYTAGDLPNPLLRLTQEAILEGFRLRALGLLEKV